MDLITTLLAEAVTKGEEPCIASTAEGRQAFSMSKTAKTKEQHTAAGKAHKKAAFACELNGDHDEANKHFAVAAAHKAARNGDRLSPEQLQQVSKAGDANPGGYHSQGSK